MPPITHRISAGIGHTLSRMASFSFSVGLSSGGGAASGFSVHQPTMKIANSAALSRPGSTPAISNLPIGVSVYQPKITKPMLGGIIDPSVPAAATVAVASAGS